MTKRLEGRVATITGGGSGIGLATARRFASEGAKVVIVDMNTESGEAAAKEVGGIFVKANVTETADVENMYKVAFDTYGRIDIAFNNAGISPPDDDSILTTGLDAWDRVNKVNLTSVFLCCKYVIPYMQKAGKGSIINTASFVATMGAATSQIAYTASKGGVLSMTRELGVQFGREGIRVNALSLDQSTHLCCRNFLQRTRSAQLAVWFTFQWAALLMQQKSQQQLPSLQAMIPHSLPRQTSWLTAEFRERT